MPSCTSPSSQPWAGSLLAEGDLAGGGHLDAHLLLDVGDVGAVALAGQLAGLEVEVVLRDDEQRQALGARAADALDAHRPREHEVDDVLGHVVLGRGDEPLDALDVPGAVALLGGLGAAGADVGAGVRLGEHHRGAPLLLDHVLARSSCRGRCRCGAGSRRSSGRRRTSRPGRSRRAPARRSPSSGVDGAGWPPSAAGSASRQHSASIQRLVALRERLRDVAVPVAGSNTGGLPVAVLVRRGELLARQPVDLAEDRRARCRRRSPRRGRCRGPRRAPSTSKRLNSMSRRLLL